jgi:hypothetical protein
MSTPASSDRGRRGHTSQRLPLLYRWRRSSGRLLEQVAHNHPHPLRQSRQAAAQVVLNGLSVIGVFEDGDKALA